MREEHTRKEEKETIEGKEEPQHSINQKNSSNETITISKEALWKYSTFVLAAIVVIGGFFVFTGDDNKGVTGAVVAENAPSPVAPTPSRAEIKITDDDHVRGERDASVVIVEYSDFQCPFCSRAQPTIQQIESTYGDDVAIVYRHFPLSFHPEAQKSAEASECAAEQGKFWEMHDKLFENQEILSIPNYKTWATEIGIDTAKFNDCLDSGKYAAKIQEDFNEGQQLGVRGTPGFFINGKPLSGAQPFAAFQSQIDPEL